MYKPLMNNILTQLSHKAWPHTFTINFICGLRYFVVLHAGHSKSYELSFDFSSGILKMDTESKQTQENPQINLYL